MNAQIVYQDFGDGLAFSINEQSSLDIDQDGTADILINTQPGKLGLAPIFFGGCVHAIEGYNNEIGGVETVVMEEGDVLDFWVNFSMYFEEDEDLPLYGGDGNTYTDWDDNEANYVGVMIINEMNGLSYLGWMEVRVDLETETLYVLSHAYNATPEGIIAAGQTELTTVDVEDLHINDLTLYPNPTTDILNIELELEQTIGQATFSLKSMTGQQVKFEQRALSAGKQQVQLDVSNLASGIYQLVIESNGEFATRAVTIE